MIDRLMPRGLDIAGGPGFTQLLQSLHLEPTWPTAEGDMSRIEAPESTTVLAARYKDGVVMIGDRQATEGHSVAHRRMQKVFPTDRFSVVAISGTAGLAVEMVRLFQTELEHYEKLEGSRLSLDGKATYLARMVRQQLPLAFQGLVVVPLFAGFDEIHQTGRLFTFDVVGGRYEENDFGATGSGSREARSYLRNRYAPDLEEAEALQLTMEALVAASEEDVATAGPDPRRAIFPTVVTVTASGHDEFDDARVEPIASAALEAVR
ncbi:MAG: proteasome subunit beta [Acidimicrobiia bacterium]|nr:proteasome subunit beta [Acidimicrobiia bacterium]